MVKKAGIYDPYLNTLGGGERYTLTLAEILIELGYQVDIFWSKDDAILQKASDRFNLNLQQVKLKSDIFHDGPHLVSQDDNHNTLKNSISQHTSHQNPIQKIQNIFLRYQITKNYDLFFYLSDWSIPLLFSKKNILHIQVPFHKMKTPTTSLINSIKLLNYHKIICNSNFTQRFAKSYFGQKCVVVYPPVDTKNFAPSTKKENIILSVGRFDVLLNSKKQDTLITAFKTIIKNNPHSNWKLVLAGGSLVDTGVNSYLTHLQYLAKDLPVDIVVNPNFKQLTSLYSHAKLFWHAAGYQVDENIHPENTEHFGISPVEAMVSGCVPIVTAKGGLPEIITDSFDGFLWNTLDELVSKTQLLIASPEKLKSISTNAINTATKFSKDQFKQNIIRLLNLS